MEVFLVNTKMDSLIVAIPMHLPLEVVIASRNQTVNQTLATMTKMINQRNPTVTVVQDSVINYYLFVLKDLQLKRY